MSTDPRGLRFRRGNVGIVSGGIIAPVTGLGGAPPTVPDQPPPTTEACCPVPRPFGSLIPGSDLSWSHNARIGPFMKTPNTDCEFSTTFATVVRNQDNLSQLLVWLSNDMGATWGIADPGGFTTLIDPIISHDVKQVGNFLHIATQETSGRVAYHIFSLVSQTWFSVNRTFNVPSVSTNSFGLAFAPIGSSAKVHFSTAIVLGATSTLFGWYKLYSGNPLNNYNPIWGSDGANEIYYGSGNDSGKVEIVKGGITIFRSTASITADQWRFLIIEDDGSSLHAYLDNVDMGNSIGSYTSLNGMIISKTNQGQNGNNFRGWIDEPGIFNRGISGGERTALYNSGNGVFGDITVAPFDNGLVLGYHFEEGSGSIVQDYSSSNNDGTLTTESGSGYGTGIVRVPGTLVYDASYFVDGAVSIDTLSGGGIAIAYDSTPEDVGGTLYSRYLLRVMENGLVGPAEPVGRIGEAQNSLLSRIVADNAGRLQLLTSVSPGFFVGSTPDLEVQTRLADGSLTPVSTWHFSGLLGGIDRFYIGTPDTYLSGSDFHIALPTRVGGEGSVVDFISSDAPFLAFSVPSAPTIWFGSDSSHKPSYAAKHTDSTHEIWLDFALSSPTQITYDTTNQAGPIMPVSTPRELDANVWRVGSTNWLGTLLLTGSGIKFELLNTSLLPTSASFTFQDWLDGLAAQDPAFTLTGTCVPACVPAEDCIYTHTTFAQLKTQLAYRLDDRSKIYWTDLELGVLLKESLRTFGLLSGFWRDRGAFNSIGLQTFYDLPTLLQNHTNEFILRYSVTDLDLIQSIQFHLLESASTITTGSGSTGGYWNSNYWNSNYWNNNYWAGGTGGSSSSIGSWAGTEMFTMNDLRYAIQRRRDQFLADTGIVVSRSLINVQSPPAGRIIIGRGAICLPENIIDIRRLAWLGLPMQDYYHTLWREDERMLTAAGPSWSSVPDTPEAYSIMATRPIQVQLAPPPITNGQVELISVNSGPALDPENGATILGIPDDLTPAIKWGALSDLLSRDGAARDPIRAAFCEQRYQQYVILARLLPIILQAQIASLPAPDGICAPDIPGVSILPVTIQEMDSSSPNWENVRSRALSDLVISGANLLAISPIPLDDLTLIILDVVRNSVIPTLDTDYVQVGREQLDMIIDYAEHLALFKVGGAEFEATEVQGRNFLIEAMTYNQRMSANAIALVSATEQSQREKQERPRRKTNYGIGALKEVQS